MDEGRRQSSGGQLRAQGQPGIEPRRAEHTLQAFPRQFEKQGLAVHMGRHHGGPVIKHEHVSGVLHRLATVLETRRPASELEHHHDHAGPVVPPSRNGRRLTPQGALREA